MHAVATVAVIRSCIYTDISDMSVCLSVLPVCGLVTHSLSRTAYVRLVRTSAAAAAAAAAL